MKNLKREINKECFVALQCSKCGDVKTIKADEDFKECYEEIGHYFYTCEGCQ